MIEETEHFDRGVFSSSLQKENVSATCQRASHDQD